MEADKGARRQQSNEPAYDSCDTADRRPIFAYESNDPNVVPDGRLPMSEGIPWAAEVAGIDQSMPGCLVFLSGGFMSRGMPEEDLFERDTEQWLRKYMGRLSDEQIAEQLRTIRLMSLIEFYEAVKQQYSDLLPKLPKVLPIRPNDSTEPHTH